MTKRITDQISVVRFITIAKNYRKLIDNRSKISTINLLQEAYKILPELCICGMNLPEIDRCTNFKGSMSYNKWDKIYKSLIKKLFEYDRYLEIFDAYDFKDTEPVTGSLADDLASIYRDIVPGLNIWDKADAKTRRDIVFSWWLNYEIHWGEHATGAFRALHCLLYSNLEDEDDFYVGIRKVEKVKCTHE